MLFTKRRLFLWLTHPIWQHPGFFLSEPSFSIFEQKTWARFLSLARSKLRLCSANHRPGYWINMPCDWPSTAWAYSEQETKNRSWKLMIMASSHGNDFRFLHYIQSPATSWITISASSCSPQGHWINSEKKHWTLVVLEWPICEQQCCWVSYILQFCDFAANTLCSANLFRFR